MLASCTNKVLLLADTRKFSIDLAHLKFKIISANIAATHYKRCTVSHITPNRCIDMATVYKYQRK